MRCSVLGPTAPTPSSSFISAFGLSLSGSSLTYAALVYCRLLFLSARVHQNSHTIVRKPANSSMTISHDDALTAVVAGIPRCSLVYL